jgi:hypothetical protein
MSFGGIKLMDSERWFEPLHGSGSHLQVCGGREKTRSFASLMMTICRLSYGIRSVEKKFQAKATVSTSAFCFPTRPA